MTLHDDEFFDDVFDPTRPNPRYKPRLAKIGVAVTEEEKSQLERQARECGLSLSSWARDILLAEIPR